LGDRITATQYQVDTQTDELKQAKATRSLREHPDHQRGMAALARTQSHRGDRSSD